MSSISVIIPHWPINDRLNNLLTRCRKSLLGYTEIILVVNEGIGFAKAVNWGLKMATGDYLAVISNDVYFTNGSLQDLIDPLGVTSPTCNGDTPVRGIFGCAFVLPKWVYEKIGGLDEQFELAYYEDDDLCLRLEEAGIPRICKPAANVNSEGGQTMEELGKERKGAAYYENQVKFLKKWPKAKLLG